MFRTLILTTFAVVVGLLWARLLSYATGMNVVVATTLSVVLAIIFVLFSKDNSAPSPGESIAQPVVLLLLAPVVSAGVLIGFAAFCLVLVVSSPAFALQGIRKKRAFRRHMESEGRFLAPAHIEPKLRDGSGTLLLESGLSGPFRVWWTEDDLSALGTPAATKEEIAAVYQGREHLFNSLCVREYLDDESGKAFLTPLSARRADVEKRAREFPKMKSVLVIRIETRQLGKDKNGGERGRPG